MTQPALRSSLFAQRAAAAASSSGGSKAQSANALTEEAVEKENDAIIGALAEDTGRLRRAAEQLRDDTREHNAFLDKLQGGFYRATDGVRSTIGKLSATMQRYGIKHMAAIAAAFFLIMVALYYLVSHLMKKKNADNST